MPIYQALTFIHSKVKEAIKDYNKNSSIEVYLDSIAKEDIKQGVYVSLLYEEEEKTLKNNDYLQTYYDQNEQKKVKGYRKVNPTIFLNLYVLILSTHSPYEEALKQISSVISYFRRDNVFSQQRKVNGQNINDFGAKYDSLHKLILNLHTLTFEQNNSLWQTLGSKLYPYVVYKVTMAAYTEKETEPDMVPVKKVIEVIKPILKNGLSGGSDLAITDAVAIEAEKEQVTKLADEALKLIKMDNSEEENEDENKKSSSVIIVNSKEVYDAIMAELKKPEKKKTRTTTN